MAIRIEPIEEKHAPSVQKLASDPAISDTTTLPSPYPEDGAITWIRKTVKLRGEGREYAFAVFDVDVLVGVCSILNVDKALGSAELGYWIGKPFWGRGYATQAGRLVLYFGFNELGLEIVHSSCLERNRASHRVLEKLGFRFTTTGGSPNSKKAFHRSELFNYCELPKAHWLELAR